MFNLTFIIAQKHWGYYGLHNYRVATLEFLFNRKAPSIEDISRLRCPVKLICGTDDVAYPQKYTEDFFKDLKEAGVKASLHVIQGAPHFVGVDYAPQ